MQQGVEGGPGSPAPLMLCRLDGSDGGKFLDVSTLKIEGRDHQFQGLDLLGVDVCLPCAARPMPAPYEDMPGFCKLADLEEIRSHGYVLSPGCYVGAAEVEEDDVPFPVRFDALKDKLEAQFAGAERLTAAIRERLASVVPR